MSGQYVEGPEDTVLVECVPYVRGSIYLVECPGVFGDDGSVTPDSVRLAWGDAVRCSGCAEQFRGVETVQHSASFWAGTHGSASWLCNVRAAIVHGTRPDLA